MLELIDQPGDDTKPALPEGRIPGIETERRQQFGIMLGAARREHGQITIGKSLRRVFIDRIQRVHQAVAESIGVNVKRRVNEMRDVAPECLVTGLELDRRAETFLLYVHP